MILKGKTQKGKNVVQRDGAEWVEVRRQDSVACFDGRPGIFIVPRDARDAGGTNPLAARWIETRNDPNFEVIE